MSKEQNSFDVVSKVETQEVNNAVSQAMKEISTRFDFKGSKSNITFDGKEEIVLISDDEQKLKSVVDILKEKLIKRKVALNALLYEKVQEAAGNTVRQTIKLQQGIPSEKAKEIIKIIKNSKLRKVQASIQGDQVRIISPSRDELQEVIKMLKESEARLAIPLQYTNYRSN
ncbi:YajQ family cyclic di-GMP-binding protein [bacterium]|nr:YajQ family cyclic di-GMP-binding protein [bacterium]MCI0612570.1 YajQ family cyclic di-GMP-binding protein [bacterium]